MSTELSEMFNHKVRNINSVLLIYTDSGIYISQTFFGNENFAFENSTAKQAVVYRPLALRGHVTNASLKQ